MAGSRVKDRSSLALEAKIFLFLFFRFSENDRVKGSNIMQISTELTKSTITIAKHAPIEETILL